MSKRMLCFSPRRGKTCVVISAVLCVCVVGGIWWLRRNSIPCNPTESLDAFVLREGGVAAHWDGLLLTTKPGLVPASDPTIAGWIGMFKPRVVTIPRETAREVVGVLNASHVLSRDELPPQTMADAFYIVVRVRSGSRCYAAQAMEADRDYPKYLQLSAAIRRFDSRVR